jgi:hypothetical protein
VEGRFPSRRSRLRVDHQSNSPPMRVGGPLSQWMLLETSTHGYRQALYLRRFLRILSSWDYQSIRWLKNRYLEHRLDPAPVTHPNLDDKVRMSAFRSGRGPDQGTDPIRVTLPVSRSVPSQDRSEPRPRSCRP